MSVIDRVWIQTVLLGSKILFPVCICLLAFVFSLRFCCIFLCCAPGSSPLLRSRYRTIDHKQWPQLNRLLNGLPFSWMDFCVCRDTFINEEPAFLYLFLTIWKRDPEFAQKVATIIWKMFFPPCEPQVGYSCLLFLCHSSCPSAWSPVG